MIGGGGGPYNADWLDSILCVDVHSGYATFNGTLSFGTSPYGVGYAAALRVDYYTLYLFGGAYKTSWMYMTLPTPQPTPEPTNKPTTEPTEGPTNDPTSDPSVNPTKDPTTDPTKDPTSEPTQDPTTSAPSHAPTQFCVHFKDLTKNTLDHYYSVY